jgi:hypothetical protein
MEQAVLLNPEYQTTKAPRHEEVMLKRFEDGFHSQSASVLIDQKVAL